MDTVSDQVLWARVTKLLGYHIVGVYSTKMRRIIFSVYRYVVTWLLGNYLVEGLRVVTISYRIWNNQVK